MFNLLITADGCSWDGTPYVYGRGRVFEHTSDAMMERFGGLEGDALNELMVLPTLFAYEEFVEEDASIGWITRVLKRGSDVRVEYEIDPTFAPIPAHRLAQLVWELDIGGWEMSRTHWAVKEVDLFTVLIEAGFITEVQVKVLPGPRQPRLDLTQPVVPIPVKPTVFRMPDAAQEPDLVSVMMPFKPEFQGVYRNLQHVCRGLGLRCLNANEVWDENEIIQDIFSLIYRSKVVICDFSERNSNVFYEAGIAHTLGRSVIPIVQNEEDIPFDLRHHRHIEYQNNEEGFEALKGQISSRIQTLIQR